MSIYSSYRLVIILILLVATTIADGQAQISFRDANHLFDNAAHQSGVAMAVVDMNGDQLDDIVRMDEGMNLSIEYQQLDGGFVKFPYGSIAAASQWSICVADVNADGWRDVITGGSYDDVKMLIQAPNGSGFMMSILPDPGGIFMQGSNFVDINQDGHIDLFACHDDAESKIWENDGLGNFTPANGWIDMSTVPSSDNSGNYGSVWTDIDNDGDLDLYIAKCRASAVSPLDPRRVNQLFMNDGNNNFTEDAGSRGLDIGAQSWTADFADINNDGDFDCFLTNHDVPSQLLENDGNGHFTDITQASGLNVTVVPIQGILKDIDNDGYVDVLVAGSDHQFFRNNGNSTFTEVSGLFDSNKMESFAVGDLNHDGFLDVYGGYAEIYNDPSNVDDVLWLNNGNDNGFLEVVLVGTAGNIDGIGARVELYGPWGIQVREVRAGESYGIVNTFKPHFGLGNDTIIDSLVIRWPSGIVDVVTNPTPNAVIQVIEDSCQSPAAVITANGPTVFCSGSNVDLSAPSGYSYEWSTGDTTESIVASSAGPYSVEVSDGVSACIARSPVVIVEVDPVQIPEVNLIGDSLLCEGEMVTLSSTSANAYEWSNGDTTQSIQVSDSGSYIVYAAGLCSTFASKPVHISVFTVNIPETTNDTITGAGQATLQAVGTELYWFDQPMGGNSIDTGMSFTTPFISTTASYWVEDRPTFSGGLQSGGKVDTSGAGSNGNLNLAGGLVFDAYSDFILRSVTVYSSVHGVRVILLEDSAGNAVDQRSIDIDTGMHVLSLGMFIPAGTAYRLKTSIFPDLYRNSSNVDYPYALGALGAITTSLFGDNFYYYFYDWLVEIPGPQCISDRAKVVAVVDPTTGLPEAAVKDPFLALFPNPGSGMFHIRSNAIPDSSVTLSVYDARGVLLRCELYLPGNPIDLRQLPKGLYFMQLKTDSKVMQGRVVVE